MLVIQIHHLQKLWKQWVFYQFEMIWQYLMKLKIFLKICPAAPLVMERADGLMWPAQYVCIVCLCIECIITLPCLILSAPLKSSQEQDYINVNLCKAWSTDWIIYLCVQYKKGGHCSDSCTLDITDLLCS